MSSLIDLPNLGKAAVSDLEQAGIGTPARLRKLGSVAVALRLEASGVSVCRSKLSALEGAIRGVRWHTISAEERRQLFEEFTRRLPRQA